MSECKRCKGVGMVEYEITPGSWVESWKSCPECFVKEGEIMSKIDDYQEMLRWKNDFEHLNVHSREQAREIDRLKIELSLTKLALIRLQRSIKSVEGLNE